VKSFRPGLTAPLAFAAGLLTFPGFAPLNLFPLPVIALAVLFVLWSRAQTPRRAAWLGFWFGIGMYGAGISFLYIAMHDYGGMDAPLAALATLLAAAILALCPALGGYLQARLVGPRWLRLILTMPAAWTLLEWVRGHAFTGLPWVLAGYSQVGSPLGGYAAVLGVYGVSAMVAISAGLLAYAFVVLRSGGKRDRLLAASGGVLIAVWACGALLRTVTWTDPIGKPLAVSLLQGNIPQDIKFNEDQLDRSLETYRRLVMQSDARLIVLPETAFPMLRSEVPEALASALREHARRNDGDVLIGVFETDHGQYFNAVYSLGTNESQSYRKNHLVPFGEYIPLRPALGWLINDVLHIPMGDLARGGERQRVMEVAGQRVAVDICYEDVFGGEIIRYLPEATLLVNVTNDAWYGHSAAAAQHNQMGQMRAMESGRVMLRATNTGVTSVIDRDGTILHALPQHTEGTLNAMVQGYAGSTPYARLGNAPVLGLLLLVLAESYRRRQHAA
jgi:apolipoprotein N-acyltransferase